MCAAERREQKAAEDAEFERQIESAKRASIEEVVTSHEAKPEDSDEVVGTGNESESSENPVTPRKRKGYESDDSHYKKQTKRARRARRLRARKKN